MKTITILSGKGGTGKTSIVSSFASLADKTVIADCDVDAADLHLVLNPTVKKTNPFSGAKVAEVVPDKCISCGLCEELCRFDAIKLSTGPLPVYEVDPIACEGCGVCEWFCPTQAIELKEMPSGEWYISDTEYGPLVHAKLGIAAENSGRLVTVVRNFANGIGVAKELDYLLIDGPPGTGCPVIASLTGVDFVLIVTEPTYSGLHDLERVIKLAAHFGIPARVCINKWDLNEEMSDKIEDFAKTSGTPVIGKVPFDSNITRAQIDRMPVVVFSDDGAATSIRALWTALIKEISNNSKPIPENV